MEEEPLPPGWTMSTLDRLLVEPLANGRSVPTASDGFPVLRLTALRGGRVDLNERKIGAWTEADAAPHKVRRGDFLVARGNGSLSLVGRGGLVDTDPDGVAYPDTLIRVRTDPRLVLPRFLRAIWNSDFIRRQIETTARTTAGIYKINQQDLRCYRLPVPPLPEQHRIVAAIEQQFTRLDAAVADLQQARAKLKRYRAAVLAAACSGRLVTTDSDIAPINRRDESSSALVPGTLPDGWRWITIAEIGRVQGGIQKQPKRAPRENAYPFLRVANVLRGRLDLREVHRMELFGNELSKLRLEEQDLLIVEGNGSASEIGRMAIWTGLVPDCVHQNHIIRVRLTDGILPKYIESFWNSPVGSDAVKQVASSTSGLYTLSVAKINRLSVPLPTFAEQHRIVAEVERRLSVVDEMEATVAANLKRAERMRQAILRRAFAGKLVPQNPDDEPAVRLLERIQTARAARVPETLRNRRPRRAAGQHSPAKL